MKKRYSSLLAATGMVAFSILGFQSAAHAAWPTGCSNGKYEEGWEASCRNSNGGRYKATVTCIPDGGGKPIVRYPSVWKSRARSGDLVLSLIQTRAGHRVINNDSHITEDHAVAAGPSPPTEAARSSLGPGRRQDNLRVEHCRAAIPTCPQHFERQPHMLGAAGQPHQCVCRAATVGQLPPHGEVPRVGSVACEATS